MRFVTITPDAAVLRIPPDAGTVAVCERDRETADAVAADVVRVLANPDIQVVPLVFERPEATLSLDHPALLFSPRAWADLPDEVQRHDRVGEIRYVFDRHELSALARQLGWKARQSSQEARP